MANPDVQLAMIDGRDALLMVLIKPGHDDAHVHAEAHCRGLDKREGANLLMQIAARWQDEADADDTEPNSG